MTSLKVLVLDRHLSWLDMFFPGANVQREEEMFGVDTYEPETKVVAYLNAHAVEYGLIIIGNNLGAGIMKAAAIPYKMRNRAIVVWNDHPSTEQVEPYKAMGYTHFCSRGDLRIYLENNPEVYQ